MNPSSLISPEMKAIFLPSGDQRGQAIWSAAGRSAFSLAARYAQSVELRDVPVGVAGAMRGKEGKLLLSGDQSNS